MLLVFRGVFIGMFMSFLGLNVGVCKVVDRVLDAGPPLVREVIPEDMVGFGDLAVLLVMILAMMVLFSLDVVGLSGVRCFIAHCVLDFAERLCLGGYAGSLLFPGPLMKF